LLTTNHAISIHTLSTVRTGSGATDQQELDTMTVENLEQANKIVVGRRATGVRH